MERLSKFLSYVLRHHPHKADVTLDKKGWVDVSLLIEGIKRTQKFEVTLEEIEKTVQDCPKQRYSLKDGKIRANQGHSVKGVIAFDLRAVVPPRELFHGTSKERWERGIKKKGLLPMSRHHVHLSSDLETAKNVGSRHRKETLLLLKVNTPQMYLDKHKFYISDNGVWFVDEVPVKYLEIIQ